jgi:hypothetical protein
VRNPYDPFAPTALPLFDQPIEDTYLPIEPSRAAKESIRDKLPELRAKVLAYFRSVGELGATDEEGQAATGLEGNCFRPRRGELVKADLVTDSGRRRPLQSGRMGTVWVIRNRVVTA